MNNTLNILQHNVHTWNTNKNSLTNVYYTENPDIILINSHGTNHDIKIHNYTCYTKNTLQEQHNGTAIAIKNNITHRLIDNFESDMIGVSIDTRQGPINIITTYNPPRLQYLHYPDYMKALTNNRPTYIIGDMNARHITLGYQNNNDRGDFLKKLIDRPRDMARYTHSYI